MYVFGHKIESPHLTLLLFLFFYLGGVVVLLCATCMFGSHTHCLCSDTALKGEAGGLLLYGPLMYCHIYDGVYMAVTTLRQMPHTEIDDFSCTQILF